MQLMKALSRLTLALLICASLLAVTPLNAQNIGSLPGKAKTAGAGLVVSYDGGKSTIMYGGTKVFEGPTKAKAVGVVKNVNGVQYAAAFDGSRVIWENVKGASTKVR
jgi:hypothetical protein